MVEFAVTTIHELKTLAPYWEAIKRGEKNFDIRRDDRGFQRGDIVELIRFNPDAPKFQPELQYGPRIRFRIGWILTGGQLGIEPGYVILALHNI